MRPSHFQIFTVVILMSFLSATSFAQYKISGTLTDITKYNAVEGASVYTTSGSTAITDSFGRYSIQVVAKDSIYFVYNNKPTQRFPVSAINNPSSFEVSLKVPLQTRYTVLQEVVVITKSYKEDSVTNREENKYGFKYTKPGLTTSISPSGMAGADVNELINIFRFKRNKRLAFLQNFLVEQEEERYINFRFSAKVVRRITGLEGPQLDTFLKWYRPTYEFTASSNEIVFNQYILNSLYHYRKIMPLSPAKKEEDS